MRLSEQSLWILFFSILIAACSADEIEMAEGDQMERENQWVSLFDGSSLEHWRGYRMDDIPDGWVIDGDELLFEPDGAMGGYDLITRETFGDFELELEYMISESGNSGIFHHALEHPELEIYWSAPEFQVLDNDAFADADPNQLSSALYDLKAPEPQNSRPAGEWNSVRIISDGPEIEYWKNGERVLTFERWSVDWFEMIEGTKFEPYPMFGTIPDGHIGLQDHGDEVRFRNIRIRRL